MEKDSVLMAEIVGAHGIRGQVKLKIFSDDARGLSKTALLDKDGKAFALAGVQAHGNIHLATLKGVTDRTAAEKLRGTKLYMSRAALPKIKKKDTFYHADLVGLDAVFKDGREMGKIINVANFGAGDLLEIKPAKGNSFYVPFTNSVVPKVDIDKKIVTVDPPEGLLDY